MLSAALSAAARSAAEGVDEAPGSAAAGSEASGTGTEDATRQGARALSRRSTWRDVGGVERCSGCREGDGSRGGPALLLHRRLESVCGEKDPVVGFRPQGRVVLLCRCHDRRIVPLVIVLKGAGHLGLDKSALPHVLRVVRLPNRRQGRAAGHQRNSDSRTHHLECSAWLTGRCCGGGRRCAGGCLSRRQTRGRLPASPQHPDPEDDQYDPDHRKRQGQWPQAVHGYPLGQRDRARAGHDIGNRSVGELQRQGLRPHAFGPNQPDRGVAQRREVGEVAVPGDLLGRDAGGPHAGDREVGDTLDEVLDVNRMGSTKEHWPLGAACRDLDRGVGEGEDRRG